MAIRDSQRNDRPRPPTTITISETARPGPGARVRPESLDRALGSCDQDPTLESRRARSEPPRTGKPRAPPQATGLVYEDRVGVDPSVIGIVSFTGTRAARLHSLASPLLHRETRRSLAVFLLRMRPVLRSRVTGRENGERCASHSSGTPVVSSRPDTVRCCAIRGSRPRTSARGSRSRATTGSTRRPRRPDYLYISHLHRDHFDPEWLARHVSKQARVLLPEFGIDLLARELAALGFHDFVRTRHGEPIDLDGLRVTILAMTSPGRRTARRLRDRARRRLGPGPQPERRPARRSRRGPRARPVRRAAAPVLRARSGSRSSTTSRPRRRNGSPASKRIDEMDAGRALRRGGRRRATCSRPRDRRASSTPTSSRSTISTAIPPTSSRTRPSSSTSSRRTASTTRT